MSLCGWLGLQSKDSVICCILSVIVHEHNAWSSLCPLHYSGVFLVKIHHSPDCTHSLSLASFNSWILLFLCFSKLSLEFSSSQVVTSRAATTLATLQYTWRCQFPSWFYSLASASNSVRDLMFLARIIYDNSYEAVRFFLFLLSSCSLFFMTAVLFLW